MIDTSSAMSRANNESFPLPDAPPEKSFSTIQSTRTSSSNQHVQSKPNHSTLPSVSFSTPGDREDDDIESLISDRFDIASEASSGKSRLESNAIYVLADYFARVEELVPLHKKTLLKISKERFANNYRRILKSYYIKLLNEASNEKEKMAAKVLRKRTNRASLAREIVEIIKNDEKEQQDTRLSRLEESRVHKGNANDWLAKLPTSGEPLEDHDTRELQGENSDDDDDDDDDGDDESSDEELEFPKIKQIELFLRRGPAFRTLLTDLRILRLPGPLREIINTVPKASIAISSENDTSVLNRAKSFLEDYTGYCWDWWPLRPPLRDIQPDNKRVEWKVSIPIFRLQCSG